MSFWLLHNGSNSLWSCIFLDLFPDFWVLMEYSGFLNSFNWQYFLLTSLAKGNEWWQHLPTFVSEIKRYTLVSRVLFWSHRWSTFTLVFFNWLLNHVICHKMKKILLLQAEQIPKMTTLFRFHLKRYQGPFWVTTKGVLSVRKHLM